VEGGDDEAGVNSVPMFVIGERVLTGLQAKQTLEAVIEEELARHEGSRGRAGPTAELGRQGWQ
jgi:predicted DsbA family dithiol-disulfide isomerase